MMNKYPNKFLLSCLLFGIVFSGYGQYMSDEYTPTQIVKAKIKEVKYTDTLYNVIDSFGRDGKLMKSYFSGTNQTPIEQRVYNYVGDHLVKIDYFKNFTKIRKRYGVNDTLTEYEGLHKSGEDYYYYDTVQNKVRLNKIVGFDWGRYVPTKNTAKLEVYEYSSDSISSLLNQVKLIYHHTYIYDSQDTFSKVIYLTYSEGKLVEEKIEGKSGENIQTTYFSYNKVDKSKASSVTYLSGANSPNYETVYMYNLVGHLVSIVEKNNSGTERIKKSKYSFSNY